jgi:hypothetical protein
VPGGEGAAVDIKAGGQCAIVSHALKGGFQTGFCVLAQGVQRAGSGSFVSVIR